MVQLGSAGGSGSTLPVAPDLTTTNLNMSQASGKVALSSKAVALGCGATATPCALPHVDIVDLVSFGAANNGEGGTLVNAGVALTNQQGAVRQLNGCQDTDNNNADFAVVTGPIPRNSASSANVCPVNKPVQATCAAAVVTRASQVATGDVSATDSDGTVTGAAITGGGAAGITVENVAPAPGQGGVLRALLKAGAATPVGNYNVVITFANNDTPAPQTASCTVPVTVGDGVCPAATITPIPAIQGTGGTSPLVGQNVTIRGAVAGSFQGSTRLNGFFVQDAGDANPQTSDGIFVFAPGVLPLVAGDTVQVAGKVAEFNGLTELTNVTAVTLCGDPLTIAATPVTLPETVNGELEHVEGMLVTFPQTLTANQNYFQGRYGQITLSSGGRMFNPTNGNGLGDTVDLNARRMLVLDDGRSQQNPNPIPYIGADSTHRAGDTIANLTGVIDYGPINSSSPPAYDYRIHPTQPVVFAEREQPNRGARSGGRQSEDRRHEHAKLLHHHRYRHADLRSLQGHGLSRRRQRPGIAAPAG